MLIPELPEWKRGWHVASHKNLFVNHENGNTLCGMVGWIKNTPISEMQAAARLIAEAPRLLLALQVLQANPNDPAAHRMALDAIREANSEPWQAVA